MTRETRERIPPGSRLRSAADFARLKSRGRALRGAHCLVVVEACPGETSKVAFVASRKGVGGAVQRNRARRRLREIVRRRWAGVPAAGVRMMFVAFRSVLTAAHTDLVVDVERLLAEAVAASGGALS
jgi:ribonuclease P protein component